MTIYDLSMNDMRKEIKNFYKTNYGKTVFLLAYALPIVLILITVALLLATFTMCYCSLNLLSAFIGYVLPISCFLILITFVLGSRYYYRELRIYVNKKSNK